MIRDPQRRVWLHALFLLACLGIGATAPQTAKAEDAGGFVDARGLLLALEEADQGIETLSAQIQYDKRFKLQGDVHRRQGHLLFRTERDAEEGGAPQRAFEINFTSLQIGGRLQNDRETWIFDGHWLVEIHPDRKQFVKREIAGEGDRFDPLAIGEGPMPIPIGQKADEVLARYYAELAPVNEPFANDEAALAKFVKDTWQLKLTPRPGAGEDEKFKEIRIWYSKSGKSRLLPRMARTLSRSGDVSYVQLINVETNVSLPRRAFDVELPPAGERWDIQIETLPEADRREGSGG